MQIKERIGKMKEVLAVLVTFNRKECLKKLVNSLFNLEYKLKGILILDNDSTDGTIEQLQEMKFLAETEIKKEEIYKNNYKDIECYYYLNNENTGGAGGFAKVVELSLKIKYDYLWIMDDDVLPDSKCLSKLIESIDDNHKVCIPNRTCENFKDKACIKLDLMSKSKRFGKRKDFIRNLENSLYEVYDMPFEGPLISRDIVEKVGLPNKDYFIFFDDTDYATRCTKYTKIYFVTEAILNRQLPLPVSSTHEKRKNWRNYYFERNIILFMKKHGNGYLGKIFFPSFWQLCRVLNNVIRFRFYNVKVSGKALVDGIRNKKGKTVQPGKL